MPPTPVIVEDRSKGWERGERGEARGNSPGFVPFLQIYLGRGEATERPVWDVKILAVCLLKASASMVLSAMQGVPLIAPWGVGTTRIPVREYYTIEQQSQSSLEVYSGV